MRIWTQTLLPPAITMSLYFVVFGVLLGQRIKEIEGKLSNAQVIDVTAMEPSSKVIFGTTVELLDLDSDETVQYQIVGEDEADIKQGKISVTSPFARAMIGKEEGDEIVVDAPGGKRDFEIVEVKYI